MSEMDHNVFQLMTDLVLPFKGFITKLNYPTVTEINRQKSELEPKTNNKNLNKRTQSIALMQQTKKELLLN